jgi:signal transduction histidine kinase
MDFRSLQSLALKVGEALTLDEVFARIVQGLAGEDGVALARVWLISAGDLCDSCKMRQACPDQSRCLHLVASAGASLDCTEDWSHIDGHFRRMPLGVGKVGQVGAAGPLLCGPDLRGNPMITRPEWVDRERIISFAGQPLVYRGETLGVLAVFSRTEISAGESDWLRIFADHAAIAISNARALQEVRRAERALRRSRERTLEARFAAVLAERTRMAREIHDTLLQGFTGVALRLVAVTDRVSGQPETSAALREVIGLAQSTLQDARRAVWDLRLPGLVAGDFPSAVRTAAEDCTGGTPLDLEFGVGGSPRRVDPEVESTVVRVAQEAITNVVKHADAHRVQVKLSFESHRLRLSVSDDGCGFAVSPDFQGYGGHWGLIGMRERASQVRGKLKLRSTPGRGTELVLLVPYSASQLRNPAAPEPATACPG